MYIVADGSERFKFKNEYLLTNETVMSGIQLKAFRYLPDAN